MKIGYILTTFPCLTETFAAQEIECLRKLGFDITVFAAAGQRHTQLCRETLKVIYRPSLFSADAVLSIGYISVKYPLALVKLFCLILKLVGSYPREAVTLIGNLHTIGFFAKHLDHEAISHVHAYFLSWPATIGLALCIATGKTFSISAHARDIFVEHGTIELKVSRAKFVRTCTRQGLEHLKANLPSKYHHKLNLVYHGVKVAFEHPDAYDRNVAEIKHSQMIVTVGRMVQKKGFEGLLKALASVVQERPQCKLSIVGGGPGQDKLNSLVEQLALQGHVQLLGWQEHDMALRLIKQATLLVVPSVIADDGDRDGIPNVILEAFALGTPVIASNLDGISEVVQHRRTGLLVRPGDVGQLASAVKELLDNKVLQKQLSEAGYKMVLHHFDPMKNARTLVKLFLRAG
ncbi:MAG: glycosyltransferase family 4 protein [Planctomycetota bacterium]|nr:glycosyltransferase family 4 protein [Planctomycetota bacterium]